MICVFSFCNHDRPMALELAKHIECLGGVREHQCLILHPSDTDPREIEDHLKPAFGLTKIVTYPPRLNGWPDGPNQCFYVASKAVQLMTLKEPWLWLEADCVPTGPGWLTEIYNEWRYCSMPILGALCDSFEGGKVIGKHVTGVAVYPHDLYSKCPPIRSLVNTTEGYRLSGGSPPAFDTYLAPYTVPLCAETKTIRHYWKSRNFKESEDGTFCEFEIPHGVSNKVDMSAALIHGCKDYTMLDIVQRRLTSCF